MNTLLTLALLAAFSHAQQYSEALLIVKKSEKAYSKDFSSFLERNSVRITQAWPPSAYFAYLPPEKDKILIQAGILVYRGKIDDWTSLGDYGEKAVLAANLWNKRFVQDPPKAPLAVSLSVKKVRKDIQALEWNEVMKACGYKLQVSRDKDFSGVYFETLLSANSYIVLPAFWPDGVYYWRVAALLCLNSGENRESSFSDISSFASAFISKNVKTYKRKKLKLDFSGGVLNFQSEKFPFYRVKIFEKDKTPLIDVVIDTNTYDTSDLLEKGKKYLVEIEAGDGFYKNTVYGPEEIIKAED